MSSSPGSSYSVSTLEEVATQLGTLRFGDGIPTPESAEAAYDQLTDARVEVVAWAGGRERAAGPFLVGGQ
jgi:hypothetical protein